ncbi:MAG: hypothetical protein IGR92_01465 [Leptolyngbyaceae cyanobacterium T60_A2020_046]|nr:hypothetical protein [Leptolyngbyaceae cyanobacterium T60_A2020_046]
MKQTHGVVWSLCPGLPEKFIEILPRSRSRNPLGKAAPSLNRLQTTVGSGALSCDTSVGMMQSRLAKVREIHRAIA